MTTGSITAISFDLDGTLCTYDRSPQEVLDEALNRVGMEPFFTGAEYRAAFDTHLESVDDMATLRRESFAELAIAAGHEAEIGRKVADTYTALRDPSEVHWMPGAEAALNHLSERYPIAVVTNGIEDYQRAKLDALDIPSKVDVITVAGSETPAKPDPKPFERIIDHLDVAPGDTIHIGNSYESDIVGAHAAGLEAALVVESDDMIELSGIENSLPRYVLGSPEALVPPPWDRFGR